MRQNRRTSCIRNLPPGSWADLLRHGHEIPPGYAGRSALDRYPPQLRNERRRFGYRVLPELPRRVVRRRRVQRGRHGRPRLLHNTRLRLRALGGRGPCCPPVARASGNHYPAARATPRARKMLHAIGFGPLVTGAVRCAPAAPAAPTGCPGGCPRSCRSTLVVHGLPHPVRLPLPGRSVLPPCGLEPRPPTASSAVPRGGSSSRRLHPVRVCDSRATANPHRGSNLRPNALRSVHHCRGRSGQESAEARGS